MKEKDIETQILHWLNLQPRIIAIKMNRTGLYDPQKKVFRTVKNPYIFKGLCDIIASIDGKFVGFEVKTPKTIQSLKTPKIKRDFEQVRFLERIIRAGGTAYAVSSLNEVIHHVDHLRDLNLNNLTI